MNIYRLDPIDLDYANWRVSNEKDVVWACAPDPGSARALVAGRTRMVSHDENQLRSPWEDEAVTSCVLDPTMSLLHADAAVRQDGSIDDAPAGR